MKRSDPIETALSTLSELRQQPDSPQRRQQLQNVLGSRSNLVVAKAAKLAGEFRIVELIPDLVAAFHRLMSSPMKLDKGCAAVTEIVRALYAMDYESPDVYLKGVRHIQLEPAFQGPVDTAAQLRGASALGLVRTRHPDALFEVSRLLVDKEPRVRMDAARALGSVVGDAAELLLCLKVLTGDREPDVLEECFSGILESDNERSLSFVGGYDDENEAIAEAAVIALGASRRPRAIDVLKEKWGRTVRISLRKTLLLAFATARQESAVDFLLSLLAGEDNQLGVDVITALRIYRDDERVRNAVEAIVSRSGDPRLIDALRAEF
jgi:HEAT repeat protein